MPRTVSMLIACVFVVQLVAGASATLGSQGPPPSTPQTPASPVGAQAYAFPSGAGMLFFYVRPDRTADFEAVVMRLGEVLDTVPEPARKQQAAGWRILKSIETTRDSAIYLFFFDPAIPGADYDPVKFLGEALPTEAQSLYERLKASIVRVERMGLGKIR